MKDLLDLIGATYAFPPGGLPDQSVDPDGAAIFTEAYALLPAGTMRDIVTSLLPGWHGTRAWIIARPMTGFAETFAQYAVEVAPGGGSVTPEPDPGAQAILFVAEGEMNLQYDGLSHALSTGGYAYIPPGTAWRLSNPGHAPLRFHWIRKRWQPAAGVDTPDAFVTSDAAEPIRWMPGTDKWGTTRFADPEDIRHDCHGNIVTLLPGGRIPFAETHVMEHGLYVLQGTAKYLLNKDWVEVGPGDFMWLRAFCPQACIATGDEPFRYLLYKDVNRHPALAV
ncbi:bifunctional allantoicase/(S)-ureidoglycine aminohydrolase [Aestuariicoccus sp. MJ-SS9]|uniref:bifunctional allantoicase/(S)-ureidoglycine aminohydrolase n=1 Tax=Aestuariicoccus sp. MJ-SS9 TaxID=3079855 RepID=UPI00290E562C|nr:bifunctional allantoicase/(S)-ureidoglycine aminohydrolase [Aestuariicoccus sp. MJ-SS9]MDU8910125.1 bifunctional allantoicase/(S)-ureidoglycine aminohydrolase [Aestuariicoccus sp. MJ-SS9]